MITFIILSFVYALGYAASYCMMRIEVAAEAVPYTRGHQFLTIIYSFASWAMVLIILIRSWVDRIKASGYFGQPVDKPVKPVNK
jgi:hypothetical protein